MISRGAVICPVFGARGGEHIEGTPRVPTPSGATRRGAEGKGGRRPGPEPRTAGVPASMARTHPLRSASPVALVVGRSAPGREIRCQSQRT